MKNILILLSIILFAGIVKANAQCCDNSSQTRTAVKNCYQQPKNDSKIKAWYFHVTRRCATCRAVESVTRETLKEYYGETIAFESVNREEDKDNPMIKKYKISGQALLIIKGDQVINLTNDAFLNARTNPDKLKAKIKSTIDPLI